MCIKHWQGKTKMMNKKGLLEDDREQYIVGGIVSKLVSKNFAKNKDSQMINLKKFIKDWDGDKNLIFVTHYVVISELLNYSSESGEIVVSDKKYNIIGSLAISLNE